MSARPRRVAVAGAAGRMGRMLVEATLASDDCSLAGAFDLAGSTAIGSDAAAFLGRPSGIVVGSDARTALMNADVLIDFTRPEATLAHLALCAELEVAAVIGTTGFSAGQKATIDELARRLAIVMAPNMSVGVNVTLRLLEVAARALGEGWDVEIVESHHRHKIDAPSGTALQMGETVAAARGTSLAESAVHERQGARQPGSIGFASLRGGDVVGDHTVVFAGEGERIEVTHRTASRTIYAAGALRAVRFLADRPPGLYGMDDVLGLAAPARRSASAP